MKKHLMLVAALATVINIAAQDAATFRQWGNESLTVINTNLKATGSVNLYSEDLGHHPAYAWPMGIQLKALIYADQIDKAVALYSEFHLRYYYYGKGYGAYNAVYNSQNDRYYDDNAWIAKDLMDLYDKTNTSLYLTRAKTILTFCMSGERSEGGIRFHENYSLPTSEHYNEWATCATAPTTCVCLRVYKATKEEKYLTDGKRLYDFMKSQVWGIGPGYRGYENAVVMEAAILLYQITGEAVYLNDAQHIGHAMEARYIAWQTRRLNEVSCWGGHDMTDAFVNMYEVDHDQNWLNIVAGYLTYLHDNCRDSDGFYPENWNDTAKDGKRFLLLDQASAASAFFKMATTPGGVVKPKDPVALFQDANYNNSGQTSGAWSMGLKPGNYTQADLAFLGLLTNRFAFKKDISSMMIQSGYKVTLYSGDNFTGISKSCTSNISYLSTWNDYAVSLKVEDLNPTAVNETEAGNARVEAFMLPDEKLLSIRNLQGNSGLEIFDLTGHRLFAGETRESSYTVQTTRFPQGIYLLKVKSEENKQVLKVQIK